MLWHVSCDERALAFCLNFVLQVTNTQGLGMRLGYTQSDSNIRKMCVQ